MRVAARLGKLRGMLLLLALLGLVALCSAAMGARAATPRRAGILGAAGAFTGTLVIGVPAFLFFPPLALMIAAPAGVFGILLGVVGHALAPLLSERSRTLGLGIATSAFAVLAIYSLATPNAGATVPWPNPATTIRVQTWGFSSLKWRLAVSNAHGSLVDELWEDWGPADQANIYRTPGGSVVVIGAGMIASMVDLPDGQRPRAGTRSELDDGEAWTYVGAVVQRNGHLVFRAPAETPECIPTYGEGWIPVRRGRQTASC